jgi:hypothetical protein
VVLTLAWLQTWRLDLKKPKRRRPASVRKSIRLPRVVATPAVSAVETEDGDRLAALLRARLALMPPQVAADYRALAERDNPTVAEKARLSVLGDTYAPSAAQVQAAVAAIHAERGAQSRRHPAADRQSGAGAPRT